MKTKTPEVDPGQCLSIQAFGLRACEEGVGLEDRRGIPDPRGDGPRPCPFYYRGEPAICGGKEIRKLIRKGKYPEAGTAEARAYLEDLRKRPVVIPAPRRKVSLWGSVASRMRSWVSR